MIISIGIDVSKEKLDIYKMGKSRCIVNEKAAIREAFSNQDRPCRLIMEAPGKYQRAPLKTYLNGIRQVLVVFLFSR